MQDHTKHIESHATHLMAEARKLLEQSGELDPLIDILDPTGHAHRLVMVPLPPKRVAMEIIHDYARKEQAVAIVMVQDGWYRTPAPDESEESIRHSGPISKHPDRKEALTCVTIYPDSTSRMIFAPYHRDGQTIVWEPLPEAVTKPGTMPQTEQNLIKPWLDTSKGPAN
jgi:hypothetical protein